jgi:hypothetical protein
VSGIVTFDFVPAVAGLGLDYASTQARPVRGATVEVISGANVLATTRTDSNGAYAVTVPANTSAFVRVKAQLQQSGAPSFNFRVLDNTNNDVLYALDGPTFSTGTAASTHNVHAPSGWDGTSYTGARSAAPFAILDTVDAAAAAMLAVDPTVNLAPLNVYWSTANRPVPGADGQPNPDTGEIVTTFYYPGDSVFPGGIYLLGAANVDTDEYDRHVIVHEWGHYFEHRLSRSDNIGGPHTRHDRLDFRVAFSEGWGNALSGIVLADSVYRDTLGQAQGAAPGFDLEGPLPFDPNQNPGWYSEESIQEIVYDLVDTAIDGPDQLDMGFGAVYATMRNGHRTADALTSIFTFIAMLQDANPAEAGLIDGLVTDQAIATIVDTYGTNETNAAGSADVLPVYTPVDVNGSAVNVCSTDEFTSAATSATNKLGSRRYLRFTAGSSVTYTFSAVATDVPAGEVADPDLVLHRAGPLQISEEPPAENCSATTPANCSETFSRVLPPGDYVLEVYEFTNTESEDSDFPPIGRTCFDVRVQQ